MLNHGGGCMQALSAKDAKYGFGRLIDRAHAEPVVVPSDGRPVVVEIAVEEFEQLKAPAEPTQPPKKKGKA